VFGVIGKMVFSILFSHVKHDFLSGALAPMETTIKRDVDRGASAPLRRGPRGYSHGTRVVP
jgi:hypothetical protein